MQCKATVPPSVAWVHRGRPVWGVGVGRDHPMSDTSRLIRSHTNFAKSSMANANLATGLNNLFDIIWTFVLYYLRPCRAKFPLRAPGTVSYRTPWCSRSLIQINSCAKITRLPDVSLKTSPTQTNQVSNQEPITGFVTNLVWRTFRWCDHHVRCYDEETIPRYRYYAV